MLQVLVMCSIVSTSTLDPLLVKLENTVFLTGYFAQTDFWALTLEEEGSAGTMYLAHPDLFLLEYSDPEGSAMGYDGTCLYTVESDLQQVIVYTDRSPGSFLHMIRQCSDSTVTETVEMEGDSVAVSIHGEFAQGISSMRVGFTAADSLPYLFSTTDVNGNSTTYSMWDVQVMDDYPADRFTLTVPEGFVTLSPEEMQDCP